MLPVRRLFVPADRFACLRLPAGLLAAVALTVPAWWAWTDPRLDLAQVDDAKNHLLRLYQFFWMLDHGVWYPRWVPSMFMGYGYPVFNFYAPGTYYLSWLAHTLFRLDVWDSYRAVGVAAALVGAVGVYLLAVALWRRVSLGVLAAVTLLYGPYFIPIDLFKRGDLAEAMGIALLPWLLLALWQLWRTQTRAGRWGWLGLGTGTGAGIVLAHNLSALMAAAVAAVWVGYLLLARFDLRRLALVVLAGALVAGGTAFFWLPAVGEGPAVHLEELWSSGGLDYHGWFVEPNGHSPRQQARDNRQTRTGLIDLHLHYPNQLIAPPKISLAQAGLGAAAVASLLVLGGWRAALPALLLVAGGCWFLTFGGSEPVWRHVPGLPLLQFPWRLFGPLCVCLALAGAGALARPLAAIERRRPQWATWWDWGLPAAVGMLVVFNGLGDRPLPLAERPQREIDGRALLVDEVSDPVGVGTLSNREFLPRAVDVPAYTVGIPRVRNVFQRLFPDADWLGGMFAPLAGDLRFVGWRAGPLWLSVRVANDAPTDGQLGVRQLWFLGWRAWLDGQSLPVGTPAPVPEQQSHLGFVVLRVPPGEHVLNLAFGPSPLRLAGIAISTATLVSLAAGVGGSIVLRSRSGAMGATTVLVPAATITLIILAATAGYGAWRAVRPALGRFAVLPAQPARAVDGVWSEPAGQRESMLLVNLAEAARLGQAQVASPNGQSASGNPYVHVQQLSITDGDDHERGWPGASRRQWLYLHPPSSVSVEVAIPPRERTWLQASLALNPAVWESDFGDGVRFLATVTPVTPVTPVAPGESGAHMITTTVVDRDVNPRANRGDRKWVPVEADLSAWGGQTVRLTLQTLPRDDLNYDWAGWGNPVVATRQTARERPPAGAFHAS